MIRDYIFGRLVDEFGEPRGSKHQDWWVSPGNARPDVHICLNDSVGARDEAHLLVFDPIGEAGGNVVELRVGTRAEADQAVARIAQTVNGHNGHASRGVEKGHRNGFERSSRPRSSRPPGRELP